MRSFVLALALIAVCAAASAASVPDPANSDMDRCMVLCPAGDFTFHVVVRDFNNVPIQNSGVEINFCNCPNLHLCPANSTDPYDRVSACSIRKLTDASGRADFAIRAGGLCPGAVPRVFADGVLISPFLLAREASTDQDGDLTVTPADVALVTSKIGGSDLGADINCDEHVDSSDVSVVQQHLTHHCPPDPTPTTRSTWGRLKTIYR